MTVDNPYSADEAIVQEILQILENIELASQEGESQWTDKRASPRIQARLACKVRYLSPDSRKVLDTSGWTRDISRTGMGFVTGVHFARKSELRTAIQVGHASPRILTGEVVYSRMISDGWYLTGMKFEPVTDERLFKMEDVDSVSPDLDPTRIEGKSSAAVKQEIMKTKWDRHRQMLKLLHSVASNGTRTRDTINQVLLCTASPNVELRRASIQACMRIPREEGITALIALLDDSKDKIQAEAAESLGHLSASAAITPLKQLMKRSNPEVSLHAAGALGRIGDRSGLSMVITMLESDNPHTRLAAMCFGAIVGHNFRPNSQGIEEARRYMEAKQL